MSKKAIIGLVAALAVVVLIPVIGVVGFGIASLQLIAQSPASLGCSPDGGVSNASDDSTSQPSAPVDITTDDGKGITLTNAQQRNAATIIAIGQSVNVPSRGIQIALMVALQESNLRNLANPTVAGSAQHANDGSGSDHDSVGIFQQRANWGSVDQRMEPTYQAKAFFGGPLGPNHGTPRGLLDIPNWQSLRLAEAAQAVQVSKFPSAYAKWESQASAILSNEGITIVADTDTPAIGNGGGCSQGGSGGTGGAENASWTAPNGKTGADMVAYAEQYVGKVPYSGACGAAGSPTAGWCCTGFVYYMYHQVLGIDLPSPVVSGQLAQAHQIPASEAQAGDLVAWVGHHIGIYDGKGGLIHSPDWGRKLTHAKSYQFTIGGTGPTFWRVNALGDGKW